MDIPPAEKYVEVLGALQNSSSQKIQNGFLMLIANYRSPGRMISASRLAEAASYPSHSTGNEQYGSFAHQICDLLGLVPNSRPSGEPIWTLGICTEGKKDQKGHFQWCLRPEVASALEMMELVEPAYVADIIAEIDAKSETLNSLNETTRETVIKARLGQGAFRDKLINYWEGCSVTGNNIFELLIASHIKPWRDCAPNECIDLTNGLLLLPNLDKAFDQGFISFQNSGEILISSQLKSGASDFGINPNLRLRKTTEYHWPFLEYHRNKIFKN